MARLKAKNNPKEVYGSMRAISASSDDLPGGVSNGILVTTAPATGIVLEDGSGTSQTVKFPVGEFRIAIKKVTNLDSAVAFALY